MQARQAFVFATAARDNGRADWLEAAVASLDWLLRSGRRGDGLFVTRLGRHAESDLEHAQLYEQAFVLLALGALHAAQPTESRWRQEGESLWRAVGAFALPGGGYFEWGDHRLQANAQMHLLEAALDWDALGEGPWSKIADQLVELVLARFIDAGSGRLSEFFDEGWRPRTGEAGLVEPGHHFEWAWLLMRWGRRRGTPKALQAARSLYGAGRKGWDARRRVAVNALWDDGSIRDAGARLWPQTEHVKAALILGDTPATLEGLEGLRAYLQTPTPGAWRERMRPDGSFLEEPSPATSLYHLFLAIRELTKPS